MNQWLSHVTVKCKLWPVAESCVQIQELQIVLVVVTRFNEEIVVVPWRVLIMREFG